MRFPLPVFARSDYNHPFHTPDSLTLSEIPVLKSFADRLANSTRQRQLLFLIAALFTIAFIGYHFGTFDQAIHIPFLKKYADPSLFPNDQFFNLRYQHYSFFWFFFIPFYRLGILEPVMFVAYVFAVYFTFWALWTLAEQLFHNSLTSLLTVVAFCLPHIGFAGFPVFEFSLLNRTFVLPFLLWAIILFLRRRYRLAFALIGVMYNLHVVSVNFVIAMFLFDCVLEFRRVGWRNVVFGLMLFVVCALPVLMWKFGTSHADLTARREWFEIIARGTLYNLFFLIAPYPHILFITASGLSALALFFIARQRQPSPEHDRTLTNFVYAALIILGVQVITAQWYPATLIVQSQIIRAGVFILIFAYIYFAHYIVSRYQTGETGSQDSGVLAAAFVLSPLPPIALVVWGIGKFVGSLKWRMALAAGSLAVLFIGSVALVVQYRIWYPGIYVWAHKTAWYDAQIWARDNTARDAVFITPPQIWWLYESDWRVFSERSTVGTLSELLEAAFAPEYVDYWKPRFEAVAPGALARFQGNFFENLDLTAQAYYSLSSADLLRVAHTYTASYLVVEKPHWHEFPVVYENAEFIIYDLRSFK